MEREDGAEVRKGWEDFTRITQRTHFGGNPLLVQTGCDKCDTNVSSNVEFPRHSFFLLTEHNQTLRQARSKIRCVFMQRNYSRQ